MFPSNKDVIAIELQSILLPEQKLRYSPQDSLEQCLLVFDAWIQIGELDLENNAWILTHQYLLASREFSKIQALQAAITLLLHGWERLGLWQRNKRKRVYRAALAVELSAIYFYFLNDLGAATWWALHTQADDHLGGFRKGGGGRDMLQTVLGVSDKVLEKLRVIASENLSVLESSGDWSNKNGFAEDVIRQFAIAHPQYNYILAQNTQRTEFPLSKSYYQSLLSDVIHAKSEGKNHTEKRKSLEQLASYLFLLLPGCVPSLNVSDVDQAFETDVVIRNLNWNSNLMAEVFGRYFIAECKNWEHSVGVSEVGYFLYRIRLAHASFGVLFAKKGITGGRGEERAARQLIRRAFHEDKILCVVLSLHDLEQFGEGTTTFRSRLLELSEEFRFGKQ